MGCNNLYSAWVKIYYMGGLYMLVIKPEGLDHMSLGFSQNYAVTH